MRISSILLCCRAPPHTRTKLSLCQAGDTILFQNLQLKRPISKYGIWMEGEIVRVFCREKTVQVLCFPSQKNANKTSETSSQSQQKDQDQVYMIVPHTILSMLFFSRPNETVTTKEGKAEENKANYCVDEDGIISLPSYATTLMATGKLAQAQNHHTEAQYEGMNTLDYLAHNLGGWEKNTKGIGSKLLAKMGFVRHHGVGLGKHAQGIVKPIDSMVKVAV